MVEAGTRAGFLGPVGAVSGHGRKVTDILPGKPPLSPSRLGLPSLSQLEPLADMLPDAVVLAAEDGRIVMVNRQAERMFSASRVDMVGKSVEMLVPKAYRSAHKRDRARYWAWPEVRPVGEAHELSAERSDGTCFPVEISLSPVDLEEGRFTAAAVRDVSAARRAWAELHEAHITLSVQLKELERRNRGLLGINRLSEMLQAVLSEPEIHQIMLENGPRMFPLLSAKLWLRDNASELVEAAWWGDASAAGILARPEDCWAMRLGRVCGLRYPDSAPRCPHVDAQTDYLCIPIVALDQSIGVLHLVPEPSGDAAEIDSVDEALATTLMGNVALSISSVRLRQALEFQAVRDPLSGLFNRRYMEEVLARELQRSARHARPLSFLMLDIDHFKSFNDTYGHDAADALIRELARLLERSVRAEDVPCRYGGDEMVVILPDTPLDGARKKADSLRDAVARMRTYHLGARLPAITVQVGVSTYPEQGEDAMALFRVADSALLQAKNTRRANEKLNHVDLTAKVPRSVPQAQPLAQTELHPKPQVQAGRTAQRAKSAGTP